MSDSHDELASAWLDGELGPDERARAGADPAVTQARAELDAVRRQLAAPVEVPSEVRERHLALALASLGGTDPATDAGVSAAFDAEQEVTTTNDRPGATVVPLRRRRRSGVPLLARAAAVLAIVGAVGVGLATWSVDRDTDDVASPSAETPTTRSEASGAGDSQLAEAQDSEGDGSEALRLEEGPSADTAGARAEEGADPMVVAAAAEALLGAGERPAPELAAELVERFGPAPEWGVLEGPTPSCAVQLDQQHPDAAPHVVLPLGPNSARSLAVDASGDARYLETTTCQSWP